MPAARSPAQIEASRRNGARSRGPATPEGKARASRNALQHGLSAMRHLVLEDEAPSELEDLTARLMAEVDPMSEIEARLVRRLAIAFWKSERADRIEVALFDAAPKVRPPARGFEWEQADPLATFDLKRFNSVRGYQAQQGREISRCLKELRTLRKETLAEVTDEPEARLENEPNDRPAGNYDAPLYRPPMELTREEAWRNEPDDFGRSAASPKDHAPTELRFEPEATLPSDIEPECRAALLEAIQAEIATQVAAEEPDPEHLAALTRRLCQGRLREGVARRHAA